MKINLYSAGFSENATWDPSQRTDHAQTWTINFNVSLKYFLLCNRANLYVGFISIESLVEINADTLHYCSSRGCKTVDLQSWRSKKNWHYRSKSHRSTAKNFYLFGSSTQLWELINLQPLDLQLFLVFLAERPHHGQFIDFLISIVAVFLAAGYRPL